MFGRFQNKFFNLKSPIVRRITAVVFISILIVEALLLAHSWGTEQGRVFAGIDRSFDVASVLLDVDNPSLQLEELLESQSGYPVIGYWYESPAGAAHTGGRAISTEGFDSTHQASNHNRKDGTYLSLHTRTGSGALYLLTDVSRLDAHMRNYGWRITGMVLLISVFVTGACLLFLRPLLINPLKRLDDLLIHSERHGIRSANAHPNDLKRTDELGSVNRSFDHLRTELIGVEDEKNKITERFEDFAGLGADCFWEIDNNQIFTYFSGDVGRVFSSNATEIPGRGFEEVMLELGAQVENSACLKEALLSTGEWVGKVAPVSTGGVPLSVRIKGFVFRDESGRALGLRGTISDISEQAELAAELKHQATHDELTGLSNRRHLIEILDQSIESYESDGQPFSLMILDLDGFKKVNDSAGHSAGDALLKAITERLRSSTNDSDILARLGGDEFAIVSPGYDQETARTVAENIRKTLEAFRFDWHGVYYNVSASIGIAEMCEELDSREALIFAADTSCITAKKSGKNQVQVYSVDDSAIEMIKDEKIWVARISDALENNGFTLFRQSIELIDPGKNEEHFEILLRMKNPDGGYYSPGLFLPVAERNHLMPKIDRWVANNAIAWLQQQTITDSNFCMNINMSAASLADREFREDLLRCVQSNIGLNQHVCLEMTESAAMTNYEDTVDFLEQAKRAGCQIALDDFGTGFSSLSHIQDLPLDYIKIDGTFIKNIVNSDLDKALVTSVANIASVLEIKTVAEFVEDQQTLDLLGRLNIDYAQGYLFSQPEELDQYGKWSHLARAA